MNLVKQDKRNYTTREATAMATIIEPATTPIFLGAADVPPLAGQEYAYPVPPSHSAAQNAPHCPPNWMGSGGASVSQLLHSHDVVFSLHGMRGSSLG